MHKILRLEEPKDVYLAYLGTSRFHISHVLVWAPVKGDVHGCLVPMGNI